MKNEGGIVLLNAIGYFFSQGFKNIWNKKLIGLGSAGIVAASLLLFGVFLLLQMNLEVILLQLQDQCEINVYMEQSSTDAELLQAEEELKTINGVKEVRFYSREERLENVKNTVYKGRENMVEDLEEENPLRDSYVLTVDNLSSSANIINLANNVKGVDEVTNLLDLSVKIEKISNMAKKSGVLLMLIFAFAAMFIISNTIRMGVFARSQEIGIMRMVGASDSYIRGPFLVEGILLGVMGAIIASILLLWGYYSADKLLKSVLSMGILQTVPFLSAIKTVGLSFLGIGVGIGLLGSGFSVSKYLR